MPTVIYQEFESGGSLYYNLYENYFSAHSDCHFITQGSQKHFHRTSPISMPREIDVSTDTFSQICKNGKITVISLDEVRLLKPQEKPTLKFRRSPMPFMAIREKEAISSVSFATMSTKDLIDLVKTATEELSKRDIK